MTRLTKIEKETIVLFNEGLWLQYPVVLIRIDEELGWDATHAGCIEGAHALVGIDTVILFAVDAEDWSIVYTLYGVSRRSQPSAHGKRTTWAPI